ncbi:MAG: prepilin-type N-terminal cleavage/methylation domain-containing protein [Candidatus Ozemobacteraceae bacterium]
MKIKRTGFTLIEVIICSMVFMLIATALASIMQTGMVIDREDQIANEILTNMIIGRRLLMEGAPKGSLASPSSVGDKGLLQAESASKGLTQVSLEEDVDGLPLLEYKVIVNSVEQRYRVWVLASPTFTLVRHMVSPSILPRETLMGDPSLNLKITSLESKPFFEDSKLPLLGPQLVVGTWLLYEDRNLNDVQDIDELSIPFRFSVALRNYKW